jgi:SAM-dependent methyltransferase
VVDSDFFTHLSDALSDQTFVSIVLSGAVNTSVPARQDVRPIDVAGARRCQWTVRRGKQEFHENLSAAESLARVADALGRTYRNAILRTTQHEVSVRVTKRGKLQLSAREMAAALPVVAHNIAPQHLIPEGTPCPFLAEIGVMTADGRVRSQQQHKFRQINRYLEFVRDILPELPAEGPIEVVDCGCGKSGLTFALHHFLTSIARRDVRIVGLDWNAAVLDSCRDTASRLGIEEIEFRAGDIASYQPDQPIHLVVSLHACDTATDAALAQAIGWGANVIMAVPCCQHELAPQLAAASLTALLRHGLLRERFAADATDALRAALLELHSYRTQVLEFIDLEHTPKNLLLRAVKRHSPLPIDVLERQHADYAALRQLLGVTTFTLEHLLTVRTGEALRTGG